MKKNVLKNAGWIIGCRIIQSVINLIIGLITARYLGPSNYGIINYVVSVVAFAFPIMQLGLNQTLVNEFVKTPEREGEILGSALVINVISALFCVLGSIAFVSIANAGEKETILVCILYSLTLLFQATEIFKYWFQAKLLSKYPSIATLCAYIFVALYKVYLLITQKGVVWFALSNVIDYLLISIILMIIYIKMGEQKLKVNWQLGRELLSRSKYYIIPSMMVKIFQNTDRLMINFLLGEEETGLYSAAISCIGISAFIFSAVIDSAGPVILSEKRRNEELYEKRVIQLYSIITCMSLVQSIVMTMLSKPIVYILYGESYAGTAGILAVSVWYVTFSHYGSVRNIWILAEGKQKYLTAINIIGASANVLLNLYLIPIFGGIGAAIASIFTQFLTNVIIGFVLKPIRRNNYLLLQGLNPKVIIHTIENLCHVNKH